MLTFRHSRILLAWMMLGTIARAESNPPANELVYRVEGLTWGAVKGLGWGQSIAPVLVQLDELDAVQRSFSNHSGTLLRILPSSGVEMADVAAAVSAVLEAQYRKPSALSDDQRKKALNREEWRDAARIGELTAIEIRTLVLRALGYTLPVLFGVTFAVVWWRRSKGKKNAG